MCPVEVRYTGVSKSISVLQSQLRFKILSTPNGVPAPFHKAQERAGKGTKIFVGASIGGASPQTHGADRSAVIV